MRVAVVGKGGSGKSVIAGTMARVLARRGHTVLALDSDPIPGLAISLGLGPLEDAMLQDAARRDDDGRWRLRRDIHPARAVQRFAAVGPDGVRLLQFGKSGPEGLRPVNPSMQAFYQLTQRIGRFNSLRGWTIIGDLPAGARQTAYNWASYARTFLIVVEPTWQSVLTARRITRIASFRNGVTVLPVVNKVRESHDPETVASRLAVPVFATVPLDEAVAAADKAAAALIDRAPDSPAAHAIVDLVDKLQERELERVERT